MLRTFFAFFAALMCAFLPGPAQAQTYRPEFIVISEQLTACKEQQDAAVCEKVAAGVFDGLWSISKPSGERSTVFDIMRSTMPDIYAAAKLGCERGRDSSCLIWARNLEIVLPEYKDAGFANPALAKKLYAETCKKSFMQPCVWRAERLWRSLNARDAKYSMEEQNALFLEIQGFYGAACDTAGMTASCIMSGRLYSDGRNGIGKNPELAFKSHKKACYADIGSSCADAARAAMDGVGTPKSVKAAIDFAEFGCKGRSSASCELFAKILLEGPVEFRDAARARPLLEKGCVTPSLGGSCAPLADALYEGIGGPADKDRAIPIYRQMCQFSEKTSLTPKRLVPFQADHGLIDMPIYNYESREFAKPCYRGRIDLFDRFQREKEFSKKFKYDWLAELSLSCLIADPAACDKIWKQAKAVEHYIDPGNIAEYRCRQMGITQGCIDFARSYQFNREYMIAGLKEAIKLDPSVKTRKDVIDLAKKAGMRLD